MKFDMTKIEKLALSKTKKTNIELTEEEISFMSHIFNSIINSEDYKTKIKYLAGINEMSISDIKFIRNVYNYYFADQDEKNIYKDKMDEIKKEKRKQGFIDLTAVISFTIFVGVVGITLAFLIYNLL